MASAAAKYKKSREVVAKAKKEMEQAAKEALKELAKDFFPKNPNILAFGWRQYTPYWNDGDTCVFSANVEYPVVLFKTKDGVTVVYDGGSGELGRPDEMVEGVSFEAEGFDPETEARYYKEAERHEKAVTKFLNNFEEDDLEAMFGDHVEVNIDRNGKVKTEEYEHD
jgi:hypothetical protein